MKTHGLSQPQGEAALTQAHLSPRLAAARQQADAARGLARTFGVFEHQKIAARRAAANHRCQPLLRQRVSHGAACHRHVRVVVVQQMQWCTEPVGQRLLQALSQLLGAKHAAVEQQGVGPGVGVLAQKVGQVAGDGSVTSVRQAKRHQTAPGLGGLRVGIHLWKKTVHDQLGHVLLCQGGRAAAPNQACAAAQQGDLHLRRGIGGQQLLFGVAAALHQLCQLTG